LPELTNVPELPKAGEYRHVASCHLCGLPVQGDGIKHEAAGSDLRFCCHGCQQVFLILCAASGALPEGFRETGLYRVCVESGIIPPSAPAAGVVFPDNGPSLPSLEFSCAVEGMWCPSCAWLIEEVLRRMPGVRDPGVSFVTDRLQCKYLPNLISPAEIIARIGKLGYGLIMPDEEEAGQVKNKTSALPLLISAFLTGNIMMASAFFYGFFAVSPAVLKVISWPVLIMASFVVFSAGAPILKRGLASLFYGSPSMDTLIAVGALSAYIYSVIQMSAGGTHLYFDTASMLITFILFGRYIETRARQDIRSGMVGLYQIMKSKVRTTYAGKHLWVPADAVTTGQRLTVLDGETVPIDSRIIEGNPAVDESFLTGEAAVREKHPGDILRAGSVIHDGETILETVGTAKESLVGQMIAAVEKALEKKNVYERLADRIGRLFVPAVFAIAAGTAFFTFMSGTPADKALLRGLTVLIISCPCTLGIAIPLVKVCAVTMARKAGIITRNPEAFERLRTVDTIIFDKTGTVTHGNFSLQEIVTEDADPADIISRLASIEINSRHFIAREIVREARQNGSGIPKSEDFRSYEGLGVSGIVHGSNIYLGNHSLMARNGNTMSEAIKQKASRWETKGGTSVFFAWDGLVRGFLVFGDPVREGMRDTISGLRKAGREIWLVSGDGASTTGAIARLMGIENFKGQVLPAGKVDIVGSLQEKGRRVAMIGDGINDAPALATARVGCTFGAGADLIREAADLTFLSRDPGKILVAFDLSVLADRTIRQNLFFAFLYNAMAIPVAAMGMLDPLIAVIAMALSSLAVTGNVLRMSRAKV
jgi:heavy metal translocating P-type ATPase